MKKKLKKLLKPRNPVAKEVTKIRPKRIPNKKKDLKPDVES